MKKLIVVLVLALCSFQMGFGQQYDDATQNKIKVKYFAAKEFLENREYSKVIEKVNEIEALTSGPEASIVQNIKVKAYIGIGMYERAKKELSVLYKMNPTNEVLKDISSYESNIDTGIEEEKAREERARLAEIKRKEEARLAEIKSKEDARLAEIKSKEDAIIKKEESIEIHKEYYQDYVNRFIPADGSYVNRSVFFLADYDEDGGGAYFFGKPKDVEYKNYVDLAPVYSRSLTTTRYGGKELRGRYLNYFTDRNGASFKFENINNFNIIEIGAFTEGFAPVLISRDIEKEVREWNYIDTKGKLLLPNKNGLKRGYNFYEGYAIVKYESGCNYINLKGENINSSRFYKCYPFFEGLAPVVSKSKWGFINKKGEIVIPCIYKGVSFFKDGKASVLKNGKKWFFINKNGEKIK
ncbi:WG repeat-containing protein [Polaribacter sp. Z014]|uniref:WG repeat-containing protein n=1 Tax=Polaribacter sp. Z014 TaxID=2927126 RepID=UPI0020223FE0|nr:WG repeat-containing protein [Polaribacter sp. Z014]MCL7765362.1 WG repeat-containing protein [Polaribacter sp. Z014]